MIGLACACYIREGGYDVTLIDEGIITGGTSFGNAGYASPSHLIPLASPYIIGKALKWSAELFKPFFIQPRLDRDLIRWCVEFWRSSNKNYIQRNIPPLNEILHLSRELMNSMRDDLGNHFRIQEKSCFMLYKTLSAEKKELQFASEAERMGIEARIYYFR